MTTPIRFAGKITPGEMVRAYRLAWRGHWRMLPRQGFQALLILGGFGVFALGWLARSEGNQQRAAKCFGIGCGLFTWLLLSEWDLRRKVRRSIRSGLFADGEAEALINDEGVSLTDGRTNLHVPWDKFVSYRCKKELVVFYIDYPRCFMAFVRRLATTSPEWDRFLTVSNERLKVL